MWGLRLVVKQGVRVGFGDVRKGSLKKRWSGDGSSPRASNRAWLVCKMQDVGELPTLH